MQYLTQDIKFPNVNKATKEGLLAIGGDLSVARLTHAYKNGIFPWFSASEPILWWSPNPRFVLFPEKLKVSKSMKQILRNSDYKVTINKDFKSVISECSKAKRDRQNDTWITNEMVEAYVKLHEFGYAKSVEVWLENELVGGLYGIDLGHVFCGESMFSKVSNASKLAFIYLVQKLNKEDYKLIDCQVYNNHLASLGAKEISRKEFLKYLNKE